MNKIVACRVACVNFIKSIFGISNMTLFKRKQLRRIGKLIHHQKYTAQDIVNEMQSQGLHRGSTLILHSAMGDMYNYTGTIDELIDAILGVIGEEGTLCMPAYPFCKDDQKRVFDVRSDKTAAGIIAETFRKRPGVKRSLNKLHSVCALGKNADIIVGEHHLSTTCFDEHSPFYIIGELGGMSFNIGLPKWFVGTGEHVCESLLYDKLRFFRDKFISSVEFSYITQDGTPVKHTMLTKSKHPYIRKKTCALFDNYFERNKYHRTRLSNIWITSYDMKYLIDRLSELAMDGKTIYAFPKFYK